MSSCIAGARSALNFDKASPRFKHYPHRIALLSGVSAAFLFGCVSQTLAQQAPAPDTAPTGKIMKAKKIAHHKPTHPGAAEAGAPPSGAPGLPPLDAKTLAKIAEMQNGPARLDSVYGYRGNNIPFPSYGDTLLQDYGGWRSKLAEYGFGLIATNIQIFEDNTLNTPIKGPNPLSKTAILPTTCITSKPAPCPGGQTYFGERPAFVDGAVGYLTYDLSRWGVPDGQLAIAGGYGGTTANFFSPNAVNLQNLTWQQSLFDKKVEVRVGYQGIYQQFAGVLVGGVFANTFGPTASIPVQLGMSAQPVIAPAVVVTWHVTDSIYNKFAVQRSLPVDGTSVQPSTFGQTTANPFYDEVRTNPTGFNFSSPIHGTRELYVEEIGYQTPPLPGSPSTWIRAGAMYNTSAFNDFTKISITAPTAPLPTTSGNSGAYLLADRQLFQLDPSSPFTAYRGIYAGLTAMYAPPSETLFSQYYEARIYSIGPFESRPTDLISFVYNHNVFSNYLVDGINNATAVLGPPGTPATSVPTLTGVYAHHASNAYTVSYLAHLMPGIYASVGLSYTDNPSPSYFPSEGHSLNFLASTVVVF